MDATLDEFLTAFDEGIMAAECSTAAWDGSASRFDDAQYARSCVLDRADCSEEWRDKPVKQRYSLPVREPGGALNKNAVAAAKGRLGQTSACSEAKSKASARLDRAASACGGTESEVEETPVRAYSPGLVGQLVAMAGRPWCLKPEAMDVLSGAISAGFAIEIEEPPERPKPQKRVGIAIIPLSGLLTPSAPEGLLGALLGAGSGLTDFRTSLGEALADDEVKAIVIDVNSPGGLVDQVPETAAIVRAAREHKPITAVASTQAASAAYWIASQANEVVVTPSGEVGSIGCYMMHMDKSGHLAKEGLNVTLTSAGKYKTEGNVYAPLSDSAKEAQQRKVDRFYSKFVHDVAAGRDVSPDQVRGGYGEGRTLLAEDAVEHGLADRVATVDQVIVENAKAVVRDASESKVTTLEAARERATVLFG